MTRDEIIEMAREADCGHESMVLDWIIPDGLERFASLVAAKERKKHQADIERWKGEAAKAEKWRSLALSKDGDGRTVQRIQQEAAEAEREACAQVCDAEFWLATKRDGAAAGVAAGNCAADIRDRGQ